MAQQVKDVRIGQKVNSKKNGDGMVTNKTKRTITVVFENGNTVKITYKTSDACFYGSEF